MITALDMTLAVNYGVNKPIQLTNFEKLQNRSYMFTMFICILSASYVPKAP